VEKINEENLHMFFYKYLFLFLELMHVRNKASSTAHVRKLCDRTGNAQPEYYSLNHAFLQII
jgi:hypothetical protein